MKLGDFRVSILLALTAGFITRSSADDCQDQLQAAATTIEVTRGPITITDTDKITPSCRSVVFSDVFPSQACNLNDFPAPSNANFAPTHLLRQASLFALQQIEGASNLNELALSPPEQAISADIDAIKAVTRTILGRISQFVDPTCSAAVAWTPDPLRQKLDDFIAVDSLRRTLASIPPRKGIFWPKAVLDPVALVSRQDTRHFIGTLLQNHNTNCLLLLISDLQVAVSGIIDSAQPSATKPAVTTTRTILTQQSLSTTPIVSTTRQNVVITTTSTRAIVGTTSTLPPGNAATEVRAEEDTEDSGVDPEDAGETEEQRQLRLDRQEFAEYLAVDKRENFQIQAIRALKQLQRLGKLPTVDAWKLATQTNLAKQRDGVVDQQGKLNGLSRIARERVNNPIFHRFDARSTGNNIQANLGLEDDQSHAIVVLADALQELNATVLKDKGLLTRRVSDLATAVDNLLKQNRDSQGSIPSQSLQVQINSLNSRLAEHTVDCNKQSSVQSKAGNSTGAFYSFKNLNEVLSLLKGFIGSYKTYRATVKDWGIPAVTRVSRTSGSESSSPKKLFKKLLRTGNIFRDTLRNTVALNEIFKNLNSNSKVIKEFHPNNPTYQPSDYAKEADKIYGSVVDPGSLTYSQKNNTFYAKVIASIQERYPNLTECCIIAWVALSCTSIGTCIALLVCCVNFCCVCSKTDCQPCCRPRSVKDTCAGLCGCVEPTYERGGTDPQAFGYSRDNPDIRHSRAAGPSAPRDSAQSSHPLVHSSTSQPRGVRDYSTPNWQKVLPGQQSNH